MENLPPKELIEKYLANHCTEQEQTVIESWYLDYAANKKDELAEPAYKQIEEGLWVAIEKEVRANTKVVSWIRVAAAAALLIFIGFAAYLITKRPPEPIALVQNHSTKRPDFEPGGNKAVLNLANGKKIVLSATANGVISKFGNVAIKKRNNGVISCEMLKTNNNQPDTGYNTLSTPKGGKYNITFADGTVAMLDALSSISFPSSFKGKTREVITTGQVYFEVAHDAGKPFRVITKGQVVEVLGTHFNISAYDTEQALKTTLLKGSVRVSRNGNVTMLKPGDQVQVDLGKNKMKVIHDADTEEAVAWKNGFFQFNNADIKTVMAQLSRWYDVDVTYEGKMEHQTFSGKIYRNVNASQVLAILSFSKVHFKIMGKNIIVTP